MDKFRMYVGYDPRDHLAYQVCEASLKKHASIPVEIIPVREWEMRQKGVFWRGYRVDGDGQMWDDRDGKPFSTQFSFTRFCPFLLENQFNGWCGFMDADMLWRADIAELIALIDPAKALMCVKHDHRPTENHKMDGVLQTRYHRKNWSSLMLFHGTRNHGLTPYRLNNETGSWLHAMLWLQDQDIGALPEHWNWLGGWSSPDIDPKIVHFTRGTPDMVGDDIPYAAEWRSYLDAAPEQNEHFRDARGASQVGQSVR